MALVEPRKKGGPYPTKEQIERFLKVFDLHFEKGYPAFIIAEKLNVNRNTISKDIQTWYRVLANDWKESDFDSWLQKQLNRFELQRCRLIKDLSGFSYNIKDKVAVERLIFDIDTRIMQLVVRTKENYEKKPSFAPKTSLSKKLPNLISNHMLNAHFDSVDKK